MTWTAELETEFRTLMATVRNANHKPRFKSQCVGIGYETARDAFKAMPMMSKSYSCLYCGKWHVVSRKEKAYG